LSRPLLAAFVLAASWITVSPAPAAPSQADAERANKAVAAALASGGDQKEQARALVRLAWPASGKRDETVSGRARFELAEWGQHAMFALYEAVNTVRTEYTHEVVKAAIAAETYVKSDSAPEFVPLLLDSLWTGNREAKKLAIDRLVIERQVMAVHPMIDSAIDDPELVPVVIDALGRMRFEQARYWLAKIMLTGSPEQRGAAASALAQIGGSALVPLKEALGSQDKSVRLLAAHALLPVATDYELSAIYEYISKHGGDDPAVTQALKGMAATIEKAIAARNANEAASAPKDF
jgi:HEAT repeat protein